VLASLRGKVGFVPAANWLGFVPTANSLIYVTGGAAFAHVKNTLSSAQSLAYSDQSASDEPGSFNTVAVADLFTPSGGTSMFGWAAGVGADWKCPVDAGSAWVIGLEYLHYGFPSQTITMSDSVGRSLSFSAKEDVDTIKVRISYLFSIH
jgi:opacity protein-like surface antigen